MIQGVSAKRSPDDPQIVEAYLAVCDGLLTSVGAVESDGRKDQERCGDDKPNQ